MKANLLVLLAFVFLMGSDGCIEVGVVDNGFMVTDDGVELSPGLLPMTVGIDATVESPDMVREAIAFWNDRLGMEVFVETDAVNDISVVEGYIEPDIYRDSSIYCLDSYNGSELELAGVRYATDGMVISCDLIINVDYAYDDEYIRLGAKHGFGHCLAFEDDPGIDETVELRSIMSNPIDPLGDVTTHDRQLFVDTASNR